MPALENESIFKIIRKKKKSDVIDEVPSIETESIEAPSFSNENLLDIMTNNTQTAPERVNRGTSGTWSETNDSGYFDINPDKLLEAAKFGFETSVPGLALRNAQDLGIPEPYSGNPNLFENLVTGGTQMLFDLPVMIAGGAIGTVSGGPIAGAAGAFGLPAGLREMLMTRLEKGAPEDTGEIFKRIGEAAKETLKGITVGAATHGAGAIAGRIAPKIGAAKLGAEIGAMTGVGSAIEGEIPKPQDFLEAAILVIGLHASNKALNSKLMKIRIKKLQTSMNNIYKTTGITPEEQVGMAKINPEAYKKLTQQIDSEVKRIERIQKRKAAQEKKKQAAKKKRELAKTKKKEVVDKPKQFKIIEEEPIDINKLGPISFNNKQEAVDFVKKASKEQIDNMRGMKEYYRNLENIMKRHKKKDLAKQSKEQADYFSEGLKIVDKPIRKEPKQKSSKKEEIGKVEKAEEKLKEDTPQRKVPYKEISKQPLAVVDKQTGEVILSEPMTKPITKYEQLISGPVREEIASRINELKTKLGKDFKPEDVNIKLKSGDTVPLADILKQKGITKEKAKIKSEQATFSKQEQMAARRTKTEQRIKKEISKALESGIITDSELLKRQKQFKGAAKSFLGRKGLSSSANIGDLESILMQEWLRFKASNKKSKFSTKFTLQKAWDDIKTGGKGSRRANIEPESEFNTIEGSVIKKEKPVILERGVDKEPSKAKTGLSKLIKKREKEQKQSEKARKAEAIKLKKYGIKIKKSSKSKQKSKTIQEAREKSPNRLIATKTETKKETVSPKISKLKGEVRAEKITQIPQGFVGKKDGTLFKTKQTAKNALKARLKKKPDLFKNATVEQVGEGFAINREGKKKIPPKPIKNKTSFIPDVLKTKAESKRVGKKITAEVQITDLNKTKEFWKREAIKAREQRDMSLAEHARKQVELFDEAIRVGKEQLNKLEKLDKVAIKEVINNEKGYDSIIVPNLINGVKKAGETWTDFVDRVFNKSADKINQVAQTHNKIDYILSQFVEEFGLTKDFQQLMKDRERQVNKWKTIARDLSKAIERINNVFETNKRRMVVSEATKQRRLQQIAEGSITAFTEKTKVFNKVNKAFEILEKELTSRGMLGDHQFRKLNRKARKQLLTDVDKIEKEIVKTSNATNLTDKNKTKKLNNLIQQRTNLIQRLQVHYKNSGTNYLRHIKEAIDMNESALRRYTLDAMNNQWAKPRRNWTVSVDKDTGVIRVRRRNPIRKDRKMLPVEQLVSKGIVQEAHDYNLLDLFTNIAKHESDAFAGKAIGNKIPWSTKTPELYGEDKYHRMPNNKDRFGPLAGMYVEKHIYNTIKHHVEEIGPALKTWKKMFREWKGFKTAWSFSAQARNVLSNVALMHIIGDVNLLDGRNMMLVRPMFKTVQAIHMGKTPGGKYGKELKYETNIFSGTTFQSQEAGGMLAEAFNKVGKEIASKNGDMAKIIGTIIKNTAKMPEMYGAIEEFFKSIVYVSSREKGMTIEASEALANKALFNYSKVPPAIRSMRDWYSPFITFTYKAIPALTKAVARKPWKLVPYYGMYYAANELTNWLLGETDEEQEMKKRVLPNYMNRDILPGMPSHIRIPIKDKEGRDIYLDLSFILPWGNATETGSDGLVSYVPRMLLPSNPVLNMIYEQTLNKDLLTGKDIYMDTDTGGEMVWKFFGRLSQQLSPGFVDPRKMNKMLAAWYGDKTYTGHRVSSIGEATLDWLLGLKFRRVSYMENVMWKSKDLQKKARELKYVYVKKYNTLMYKQAGRYSQEELSKKSIKLQTEFMEKMKRIEEEYNYAFMLDEEK